MSGIETGARARIVAEIERCEAWKRDSPVGSHDRLFYAVRADALRYALAELEREATA